MPWYCWKWHIHCLKQSDKNIIFSILLLSHCFKVSRCSEFSSLSIYCVCPRVVPVEINAPETLILQGLLCPLCGSIPLRSIFKKPWKSLISGVFCCLVERKNAVLNRFKPFQSGKIGVKIGVKIETEIIWKIYGFRVFWSASN